MVDALREWLGACAACQRRALRRSAICPVSGQVGSECPIVAKAAGGRALRKELTKVDKVLRKGGELAQDGQLAYAELSFDKAIEMDAVDWRGYYSKALVQQGLGRHFAAFSTCRRALEQRPENQLLLELKEVAQQVYKEERASRTAAAKDGARPAKPPPTPAAPTEDAESSGAEGEARQGTKTAPPPVDGKPRSGAEWAEPLQAQAKSPPVASAAAKSTAGKQQPQPPQQQPQQQQVLKQQQSQQQPQCPASMDDDQAAAAAAAAAAALVPRKWEGRVPGLEERRAMKEVMLQVFREQWERLGKAKAQMGFKDYSDEQKFGLKISSGHRPMPRPDDVALPSDFQKPVGVLNIDQLGRFDCNHERQLISLYGDIFDVSDRPDKYGKDGPYYYFAGRDITWGLVSGQDSEDRVNQLFDLFKMEEAETTRKMQCICSWIAFYETEYGKPVGKLTDYSPERELQLPAPPLQTDDCVVQ